MKRAKRGYTIVELLITIFGLSALVMFGGALWAVVHFLAKFW